MLTHNKKASIDKEIKYKSKLESYEQQAKKQSTQDSEIALFITYMCFPYKGNAIIIKIILNKQLY